MSEQLACRRADYGVEYLFGGFDVIIREKLGFSSGVGQSLFLFVTALSQIQNFLRSPTELLDAVSLQAREREKVRRSFFGRFSLIYRLPLQPGIAGNLVGIALRILFF